VRNTWVVLAARPDVQLKIREEQLGCAEIFNLYMMCVRSKEDVEAASACYGLA